MSSSILDDGTGRIVALELEPKSRTVLAVGADGIVVALDTALGEPGEYARDFRLKHTPVHDAALSPDGALLAAVGPEGLELVAAADGAPRGFARVPGLQAVAVDGRTIVTAGADGQVRAFDLALKPLGSTLLAGERNALLRFGPKQHFAVAAGFQGGSQLVFGKLPLGPAEPKPIALEGDQLSGVAFSPSGNLVAAADHALHVFRCPQGARLLSLGPDGKRARPSTNLHVHAPWTGPVFLGEGVLAAAPPGGTILVFALPGGELKNELRGHTKDLTALVAGPDFLVSAALDGTIRLWVDPTVR